MKTNSVFYDVTDPVYETGEWPMDFIYNDCVKEEARIFKTQTTTPQSASSHIQQR